MSATAALLEPVRLRSTGRTHSILRGTRALGKSIGPLFYLVSVGITATWIVGVFFGLGFFFLTPPSERPDSTRGIESNSSSLSMVESPWLIQALSRLDQLLPKQPPQPLPLVGYAADAVPADGNQPVDAPLKDGGVKLDRLSAPPAQLGTANTAVEPESRPLTDDIGTTPAAVAEPTPKAVPPSQTPGEATGVPQGPRSGSHREQPQERKAKTRLPQAHAPVRAIEELLQKHSGLLM